MQILVYILHIIQNFPNFTRLCGHSVIIGRALRFEELGTKFYHELLKGLEECCTGI